MPLFKVVSGGGTTRRPRFGSLAVAQPAGESVFLFDWMVGMDSARTRLIQGPGILNGNDKEATLPLEPLHSSIFDERMHSTELKSIFTRFFGLEDAIAVGLEDFSWHLITGFLLSRRFKISTISIASSHRLLFVASPLFATVSRAMKAS